MAGATSNCCRLSTRSVYTIQPCTSLQCHLIQSHIYMVHLCLAVTCHLCFWQDVLDLLAEWLGYFTCYCGNMGVERILSQKWAQKVDPQEENSHTTPVLSRTCYLLIMSLVLYLWAIHTAPVSTQTCYLLITSLVLYHWAIHTPQSIKYMCTQNLPYRMLNQCLYFLAISTNIAQNSL